MQGFRRKKRNHREPDKVDMNQVALDTIAQLLRFATVRRYPDPARAYDVPFFKASLRHDNESHLESRNLGACLLEAKASVSTTDIRSSGRAGYRDRHAYGPTTAGYQLGN